jgi:predicted TIM-barrel fold metal-dependent hydrolase
MRIDGYAHVVPPSYLALVSEQAAATSNLVGTWIRHGPLTESAQRRLKLLDDYEMDIQIVTPPVPPVDVVAEASGLDVEQLVRTFNDGLAEWVSQEPDRFRGVGTVSLRALDQAVDEVERLATDLGFIGVQLCCGPDLPPLETTELDRFYARVDELGLGIWIHPFESPRKSATAGGVASAREQAPYILGWPYHTTLAVFCIAAAGITERYPDLPWILHHAGGLTPLLAPRIDTFFTSNWSAVTGLNAGGTSNVVEALRSFYVDTAAGGSTLAVSAAIDFFGLDHVIFGTDAPFGERDGADVVERALASVRATTADEAAQAAVMAQNLIDLFGPRLRLKSAVPVASEGGL